MAAHIWFQLTTHFIDPERMKGWVSLVGLPVADGLLTLVVTHQLQVERRTGKVRRPETDVLPLCHATNLCTTLHIIKIRWSVCVMIRRKTKKDKEINLTVINWVFAQTTLFVGSKLNFVWAWFEVNSFIKDPWSSLMVDEKVDVTWSLEKAIIEKCCWWPLL